MAAKYKGVFNLIGDRVFNSSAAGSEQNEFAGEDDKKDKLNEL